MILLRLIGLRGIIGGAAGLIAGFLALSAYHTAIVHPSLVRAAVAEGQAIERKAWEAQMAIVRRETARRMAEAQTKINMAERKTLDEQRRADDAEAALEGAIANETDADSIGLPRRLSKHVGQAGR